MVMGELDIGPRSASITNKEEIVVVMMQYMKVGLKRSSTCPFSMSDKVLIVLGEVYLGIRPALLPPIIQVIMVYQLVFIVMVITEVDMGIRPANCMHIRMVE